MSRALCTGLLVLFIAPLSGCQDTPEPILTLTAREVPSGPVAMRRLTRSQYTHSVRDVLGQDIEIAGQLEPDHRRDGLLSVGSAHVTVTPIGFEQYESMAYRVAEQALDETHRAENVPCTPAAEDGPDDGCAEQFVRA
ncbi:MAG: DUF1587 domain-containing protein, partial [Myxococcota bacterium]|nr:DUF1587 domain-containing protein [Myxococcota bacterium]